MMLTGFFIVLVALFQVVPPPPPPGGSEIRSIIVVDGSDEINLSNRDFRDVVENGVCLYDGRFCTFRKIMDGLNSGVLKVNRRNDINRLWQLASGDDEKREVCDFAQGPLNTTTR